MSENPSTIWYWNDWDNDRGLMLCSLAAQGLWMRMLSIAARSGGYVSIGGIGCSSQEVAALVGKPIREVERLIAELAQRRVFSRTKGGMIYSRRIVRGENRSRIARENGAKGGNPLLLASVRNKTDNSPPDNLPVKPPLNRKRNPRLKPPLPLSHYPINPLSPPTHSGAPIAPGEARFLNGVGRGDFPPIEGPSEPPPSIEEALAIWEQKR